MAPLVTMEKICYWQYINVQTFAVLEQNHPLCYSKADLS